MDIIHQDGRRVKNDTCCNWYRGREAQHDRWLAGLQDMGELSRIHLVEEIKSEMTRSHLPGSLNSMIDIADIARAHNEQLSERAVDYAATLSRFAIHEMALKMAQEKIAISPGGQSCSR